MTTHLIAVDEMDGTLWGGVPVAAGEAGLRAELERVLGQVGLQEPDDDGEMQPVGPATLWHRCTVFLVALSDDREEAPAEAPPGSELVYRGSSPGSLPDGKDAAWGVPA